MAISKEERKRDVITGTEEGTDEGGREQGRKKEGRGNEHGRMDR